MVFSLKLSYRILLCNHVTPFNPPLTYIPGLSPGLLKGGFVFGHSHIIYLRLQSIYLLMFRIIWLILARHVLACKNRFHTMFKHSSLFRCNVAERVRSHLRTTPSDSVLSTSVVFISKKYRILAFGLSNNHRKVHLCTHRIVLELKDYPELLGKAYFVSASRFPGFNSRLKTLAIS